MNSQAGDIAGGLGASRSPKKTLTEYRIISLRTGLLALRSNGAHPPSVCAAGSHAFPELLRMYSRSRSVLARRPRAPPSSFCLLGAVDVVAQLELARALVLS